MREMNAPGLAEASAMSRMRRSWLRRGSLGFPVAMSMPNADCRLPKMANGQMSKMTNAKSSIRHSACSPSRLRHSPLTRRHLQAVALQTSVESATAQAERLGGLADVAVVAGHRLFDQEALDVLEAHVLETAAALAGRAQAEVGRLHLWTLRHQDGAFDGVIELA